MKRITEQESKQYIPLKENYNDTSISAASTFTITPSEKGEGWEDVTYIMIVMQTTIDFLVNSKRIVELNELMGENLPWEQKETKTEIKYYKLN